MPNQTTNYGFIKPLDNETADIAVLNQNMDDIDSQLKVIESRGDQNNNEFIAHKADTMPHRFVSDGVTYRWGLSVIDGVVNMIYEEVI